MINKKHNLIWIDLEMTGLDPNKNYIIEIGVIITDYNLNIINDGIELTIFQQPNIIKNMDTWNTFHHTNSGLITSVNNSIINMKLAEIIILNFIKKHTENNTSPMCGNSIHHDRLFLKKYMPTLEKYFHYRNLDVSTIKILSNIWALNFTNKITKKTIHRSKNDILDSINELQFYRKYIFDKI